MAMTPLSPTTRESNLLRGACLLADELSLQGLSVVILVLFLIYFSLLPGMKRR
jgi:hypothetical protein